MEGQKRSREGGSARKGGRGGVRAGEGQEGGREGGREGERSVMDQGEWVN